MFRSVYLLFLLCFCFTSMAQTGTVTGNISSGKKMVEAASIEIPKLGIGTSSDSNGNFILTNIPRDRAIRLQISSRGFMTAWQTIQLSSDTLPLNIVLEKADASLLSDVVVTGTMKEISRTASPVPVEIITPKLFQKNPTPSLFEAVGMVNGVKPQLNCNVCNTGDIHINGMEGPYTMILIDGMPIVSALSTVYGLSGIPNSMVERIEVVKGPASSLYGSEAMGGIINVITKNPVRAPLISTDIFGTSWGELSVDLSAKLKAGNATSLLGVNYFNYQQKLDKNNDGFTDMTLQNRISVFNKWNFTRKNNRLASIAGRFVYEDRWGGQTSWSKQWRGSDSIYGESIYTRRAEIIGVYQLPTTQKIFTQFSFNKHDQNSWYGKVPYFATQQVGFLQTYWDKKLSEKHSLLVGGSIRYTHYDDNTPGTASPDGKENILMKTFLPGIFVQDEWSISAKHTLLAGYRYDYDKNHGSVHSPRLAYKYAPNTNNILRASMGTGFRVVNLFTEDHAALTGAREVVIASALRPERSYNANLNYVLRIPTDHFYLGFDITGFYSYFTNKIIGDFDTDPNKIIYDNLDGHAISRGVSLNTELNFNFPLKILAGISYMNVFQKQKDNSGKLQKSQQLHAPEWSGTFVATYFLPAGFVFDLTGKWDGPMRLPILPNDYRPEYSPWFAIVNAQVTKKIKSGLEIYGGVKNLFNFVPADPILRAFDPFDKYVDDPINNPYGYTFDPSYNFSSMQGARVFLGVRYNLK